MQVLCKASNTASDIRCNICGQGFLVYWTRTSRDEQAKARTQILESLRAHHSFSNDTAAHPASGFNLPEWNGETRFSAAALLGNVPAWALA